MTAALQVLAERPRRVTVRPLGRYTAQATEWLWPGVIPAGEMTILAGDGGLGKSTLTAWIAAKVTTGQFKGLTGMRSAWVLLGEDDPGRVLKLRYRAAGCDMHKVGVLAAAADSDTRGDDVLSLPSDFPELAAQIEQSRPELLIVDPLSAFLGSSVDAHRDGGQGGMRGVLGPLARIAHTYGTTVIVCAHLNKGSGPASTRVAGSSGLRNAGRNLLVMAPHPDARESGDDDGRRLLGIDKSNYGRVGATFDLTVSGVAAIGDDGQEIKTANGETSTTSVVHVGGESEMRYEDALSAASSPREEGQSGGRQEAMEFLRETLQNGAVPVATVNAEATTLGLSTRTVERARKALGVKASKTSSGWVLSLPPEPQDRQDRQSPNVADLAALAVLEPTDSGLTTDVGAPT